MRNLKRALSLALAAAMLISLMVVGASAADYGDQAQVKQTEAVEVLTGLGVVGGDQNGNFNPTATLTRAEFCVMIANALTGGTFDRTLFEGTATPFTDVQGHWGAAYIAYCYSVGVIAGTSATTFSPDNTLTAAQASAILLSALGYNQNNEFGANGQFELNVTKWAQNAGLYAGMSVSASAGISRENTARLIFNALTNTTPVGYSSLAESYYTEGTSALSGVVYTGNQLDATKPGATPTDAQSRYQSYTLGYKNFEAVKDSASDDFNRPGAYTWEVKGTDISSVYVDAPMASYTAKVTYGDLYNLLGKSTVDVLVSATIETDGDTGSDVKANITKGSETAVPGTGNGVLTEVYYDQDTKAATIVVINTYLAKVTGVTAATSTADRYVTLTLQGTPGITLKDSGKYETNQFAKDDYVLVTASKNASDYSIVDVTPATVVEAAAVTAITGTKNFVANGVTYKYSEKNAISALTLGDEYNVVLDAYGYAIGAPAYNETLDLSNYLVITKAATSSSLGTSIIANATFADGTSKEITLGKLDGTKLNDSNYTTLLGSATPKTIYSFTVSDGVYDLKAAAAPYSSNVDNDGTTTKGSYTNGSASFTVPGESAVTVNSATTFVVKNTTKDTVTVYTGIKNMPTIDTDKMTDAAALYKTSNGVAALVYVEATEVKSGITSAKDLVYILDKVPTQTKDGDDIVFTFNAIVDGQVTTIATKNNTATTGVVDVINAGDKGLYYISAYDGGYVQTIAKQADEATPATDTKIVIESVSNKNVSFADDVLKIDTAVFTCADDMDVYTITAKGEATIASASDLTVDNTTATYTLVLDTSSTTAYVTAVYVQK